MNRRTNQLLKSLIKKPKQEICPHCMSLRKVISRPITKDECKYFSIIVEKPIWECISCSCIWLKFR